MSKLISFSFIVLLFASCIQDPENENTSTDPATIELENKIKQLELDNALKDSVINESLSFFNEIKENLEAIGIRKDEIRAISDNKEISNNEKQWILEEIKHINYLREENAGKVKQIQDQLKKNGLKIKELEVMIASLMKDIQWKDEQISLLQNELNNLDKEYTALFDAYQKQSLDMDEMEHEMNTVYYAYGTSKELQENKVIEKKNGFLGIGKSTELKANMNDDYFTKVNLKKTKKITIEGKETQFITYHPKASYTVEATGNRTVVQIIDPSEFWKISKYLVVVTE